jgi:hypothetical protein
MEGVLYFERTFHEKSTHMNYDRHGSKWTIICKELLIVKFLDFWLEASPKYKKIETFLLSFLPFCNHADKLPTLLM